MANETQTTEASSRNLFVLHGGTKEKYVNTRKINDLIASVPDNSTVRLTGSFFGSDGDTITINKPLHLTGNAEIKLENPIIKIESDDVTFSNLKFYNNKGTHRLFLPSKPHKNLKIENCVLERVFIHISPEKGTGLNTSIINSTIRACHNANWAIGVDGATNTLIRGCHVYNHRRTVEHRCVGIKVTGRSQNTTIDGCFIYDCDDDGIDIYQSTQNTIVNCTIYNNSEQGIDSKNSIVDGQYTDLQRNIISNNKVYGNQNGIICSTSNTTVTGNLTYNNRNDGILSGGIGAKPTTRERITEHVIISNNVSFNNGSDGIQASGRDITISGNICHNNKASGICTGLPHGSKYEDGTPIVPERIIIMGNQSHNNKYNLHMEGGTNIWIEGNSFFSPEQGNNLWLRNVHVSTLCVADSLKRIKERNMIGDPENSGSIVCRESPIPDGTSIDHRAV